MHVSLVPASILASTSEPQPFDTLADGVVKPVLILLYLVYAFWMFGLQIRNARSNNWSSKWDIFIRHSGCWMLWMLLFGLSWIFLTHDWAENIDHPDVGLLDLLLYAWWWILSPIAFVTGPAMMTYNRGHGSKAATNFWRRFWQFTFICSGWWLGAFLNLVETQY